MARKIWGSFACGIFVHHPALARNMDQQYQLPKMVQAVLPLKLNKGRKNRSAPAAGGVFACSSTQAPTDGLQSGGKGRRTPYKYFRSFIHLDWSNSHVSFEIIGKQLQGWAENPIKG